MLKNCGVYCPHEDAALCTWFTSGVVTGVGRSLRSRITEYHGASRLVFSSLGKKIPVFLRLGFGALEECKMHGIWQE